MRPTRHRSMAPPARDTRPQAMPPLPNTAGPLPRACLPRACLPRARLPRARSNHALWRSSQRCWITTLPTHASRNRPTKAATVHVISLGLVVSFSSYEDFLVSWPLPLRTNASRRRTRGSCSVLVSSMAPILESRFRNFQAVKEPYQKYGLRSDQKAPRSALGPSQRAVPGAGSVLLAPTDRPVR